MLPSMQRSIVLGFLLWLAVFVVSLILFPVKQNSPIYFETLITIALVFFTVLCATLSFQKRESGFLAHGISIGILWMALSLLIDLPLFSYGPMKRPLPDYMMDIGLTYLVIPIITIAIGSLLQSKVRLAMATKESAPSAENAAPSADA